MPSKAQETIELTFTANAQGGIYCPFDAVNVTNVTRGWTATLAYPDTVLVLNSTVGIDEQHYEEAIHLGEAYPNPFTDETNVPLDMPITGEVSIQVVRIDGTVVATSRNHLEAGSYRVKVSLSSPAMAFLVATSTQGRQVVRMLCTKSGGRDSITLEPVSREYKPSIQLVRGSTSGEFQPGDMMRYTSVLFDGANTVYSNTITQPQYESEIITMLFDLTLPEVITSQVTNITQNTATGGGNVTATGGVSVTERGICWSTSHNPTISSSHASNGLGAGSYTVQMSGLTAGTTYFVRAYAINRFGTAYGNEVSFTTTQIPSYTISVSANPTNGGTVSGGGSYQQGQSCTVIATAANGYSFNNWTENGSVVSTNPNYSFTVNNNRSLVANFSVQAPNTYTINASPNPSNGGLVTGGGTYQQGQSCTVSAVANTGYTFLRWTENGNQVSTNANYTFTVTSNRTLVAQFQLQSFTISATVTPSNSGTVTGGGSYNYGQLCTLMATANTGYVFEKWTKNGTQISTEATYSFTVTESASYVAHFQLQNYTINVSANPTNGGSVTGAGSYNYGQSCTITATAAPNYTFLRWTENGNQVSTNASYTFTVTNNRFLVAQFQAQSSYTIIVSASPANGGSVSGGGTYNNGQSCTVTATSNSGYTFTNWTENSNQVSTNANYTFTVTSNRHLVANFTYNGGSNAPIGAINGLFTINANGDQIYFSQGNLQYQASTNTWRFATNQWDCIGETNANISQTYNGWIDLFGWGTSGWNNGNVYYQPWDIQLNGGIPGHGYGPTDGTSYQYNLIGTYSHADWGIHNTINNTTGQWRTLTGGSNGEWNYIFNTRTTTSGIRYAKARVNNVNGVVLLPDDWSASYYSLSNTNTGNSSFNSNVITASQWVTLEQQGAVFLPAAGQRCGTDVNCCDYADYWSATCSDSNGADEVAFNNFDLNACTWSNRYDGCSVRLVQDDSDLPTVTTNTITNITQTSATGGGNVVNAGSSTVTARGVCWSTSHNPTVSGNHTTNGTGTGSFTSNITGLTANTMYYVRAYATNSAGTAYGSEVSFTTSSTSTYTISVSSNPTNGGSVTGGGTYQQGQSCTVSATAATGYIFNNWTENGSVVSTNANYTFTVNSDRTLVAYFSAQAPNTYTISVSSNPSNGGSVTGGGTYQQGQSCTVSATANTGYTFLRWTENGNQVSANANYTFTVTGNRTLVALFQLSATAPTVTTTQITNIQQTTAIGGGNVTNSGGSTVSERGICWSTSHNPTTSGSHASGGTGTGSFTVSITGLTANTTYYVRAYAINSVGTAYGNEVSFTTLSNGGNNHEYVDLGLPSGLLWATCNVGADSPEGYGYYFAWGETMVKSTYTWSTYQYCNGSSSTLTKYCSNATYGYNGFTDNLTTLLPEDDAIIANWVGNWRMPTQAEWQELLDNTTVIWTARNGINGRLFTASNGNTLFLPAAGEHSSTGFSGSGSHGTYWSSSLNTDIPNCGRCLGFNSDAGGMGNTSRNVGKTVRAVQPGPDIYYVTVLPSSVSGGTVTGGGTYQQGQSCTVSATANSGYSFTNWTENGNVVSTNASYTFTVTGNRTLVAKFTLDQPPTGAINGLFTINANGDQVFFSQGNLQYRASTGTWRFASNQYDYIGNANSNISQTNSGWIDLFGWGTSGWPTGANRLYQPWQTGSPSLFGPPGENDLTGSYANSDWGVYNAISNGGNTTNTWRTLTGGSDGEWIYILETRSTPSGIRYAKAKVNGVSGVILLPDDWSESFYPLYNTNMVNASWSSNNISISQWSTLEQYGAVFLPAAGYRDGTTFNTGNNDGIAGYYWSASCFHSDGAKSTEFFRYSFDYSISGYFLRNRGFSVRLVQDY